LAQYLMASGDMSLLDEVVPFFHPEGDDRAETVSIRLHAERAISLMNRRVIPGTSLAAYGHGDWNDSMQPFDPAMRERLCSAWTVTLHYQTLTTLSTAFRRFGVRDRASGFEAMAEKVLKEFQQRLIIDDVIAGFAYFYDNGDIDYLLHPRDQSTGVSYSLLPMIHAIINGLLTPEQAKKHLALIQEHLHGPDGARLFDKPMQYRGGPMKQFQRAESAAFFGREIALMYTHAHLRYAEALARYGDAQGFFQALCQANPIGIRDLVPSATLRQANCYYSSSDAAFKDRYEAFAEYGRVRKGEVPLDGGWRVYSSGPGIWTRLMIQCFLGWRPEHSTLVLDPVIPKALDGLKVEWVWEGHSMEITYRIQGGGCGPKGVKLNGEDLPFTRGTNPYRTGAAEIPMAAVRERLTSGTNRFTVHIG
jgi:cellobiose phosphorylase